MSTTKGMGVLELLGIAWAKSSLQLATLEDTSPSPSNRLPSWNNQDQDLWGLAAFVSKSTRTEYQPTYRNSPKP